MKRERKKEKGGECAKVGENPMNICLFDDITAGLNLYHISP